MGAIPWRFLRDRKINDRLPEQLPKTYVILSAATKWRSRRIRTQKSGSFDSLRSLRMTQKNGSWQYKRSFTANQRFQVWRENNISMGKISRRPASISKIMVALERSLKKA